METLNNFNGMMAVNASLSQGPVHRLQKTWKKVSRAKINQLSAIEELMSTASNHRNYRTKLRQVNPPLVPYLGLFSCPLFLLPSCPLVSSLCLSEQLKVKVRSDFGVWMKRIVSQGFDLHPGRKSESSGKRIDQLYKVSSDWRKN